MKALNTAESVWSRLSIPHPTACWTFVGGLSSRGYGQFFYAGRLHTAHIVTWELTRGPVPAGLQLDHLCRNRACANPAHLDLVTGLENVSRSPIHNGTKAACPQGHPYSGGNLRVRPSDGARLCRTCQNAESRGRKRRVRAERAAQGLTSRGTPRVYRPQSARDDGPGCPGHAGN